MKSKMFFVAAILGGLVSVGAYKLFEESPIASNYSLTPAPVHYTNYAPLGSEGALDFTAAAERTVNSVVHVKTQMSVQPAYNPWMDFFGYQQQPQVEMASGSGVIISADGYIVTNNHVVEGADKLLVTLNNNKNYEATIIGADPSTDIAVIKIDEKNLPYVLWGNSDNVRVGQWVLAVGNPFELTSTVTAGIVSAKARNINLLNPMQNEEIIPIESFIQTDAAVNPGNSGGALVNTAGELIGVNTAIASRTGSYAGYSFAVPSSIAQKVANDLIRFGEVQRAFIGVQIVDVDEAVAKEAGLSSITGVYVRDLTAGGAAAAAGIEAGDIILKVGDVSVKSVPELQEQVSRFHPGDKIAITLWRDEKTESVMVTLRSKEGSTSLTETTAPSGSISLGAQFVNPTSAELDALGLSGGAKVSVINAGKLREIGVQKGFIITKIGGEKVTAASQVQEILKRKTGEVMIEGYYPNGTKAYYGFNL